MTQQHASTDFATYRRLLFWAFGPTLAILFTWFVWEVLLLALAGVLLATIPCAFTEWVQAHTGLWRGSSYAIVIIVLTVIVLQPFGRSRLASSRW